MKNLLPALVAVFLIPSALLGQERELMLLQGDIIRLENTVAEIQRSLDERNSIVQDLIEQMFDRVGTLGSAVDRIAVTLDQVLVGNDRLSGELRITMGGLADDLDLMGRALGDVRAEMSVVSQQMTSLSAATEVLGSPDSLMREAGVDLFTANYELAREEFLDFLLTFPDSPRADAAQMGLGDARYGQELWDLAVIEYDLLMQKYPESDKIPDALLKKGLSLANSGQDQRAVETFEDIVTMFPETPQALRAQEQIELLK